ncbi:MAG: citryl-CoA lyase [Candidatus Glassbacteria bacterium]
MGDYHWKSAVAKVEPNSILLRGYRIDDLMGELSYAEAAYLAIKGELPADAERRMIDAILVSSIDHGVTPPSTISAITAASTGAPMNAAIAAGLLAMSRFHGGAIEESMGLLAEAVGIMDREKKSASEAARAIVDRYRAENRRFAGYGHKIHTSDPRTRKLYTLADELEVSGDYVEVAREIEKALHESTGRKLPLNVTGAIASLLLEMGFAPGHANAFFIIARLPGLVAHIHEELTRQSPLRQIDPSDAEYDGPAERKLPRRVPGSVDA